MKKREILLWVVSVGALCLSILAIAGPRLQGVKSQAAAPRYQVDTAETTMDLGIPPDSYFCERAYGPGWSAEVTSDGRTVCVKPTADGKGKMVKDLPAY